MTDPVGARYGPFNYDAVGNLTSFTDRGGKEVRYEYDTVGNLVCIVDPNGNEYRLAYDTQRRVTELREPNGQNPAITGYGYPEQRKTTERDPNGHTTTYEFDEEGRQTKATDPLGHERDQTWTANSNVNTTTNSLGNSVTYTYDPTNKLIGTEMPTGARTSIEYTNAAHPYAPTSLTDAQGNQFTGSYDAAGNLLTADAAGTGNRLFEREYNDDGTVRSSKDGNGNVINYGYDDQGQLTTVTPPAPRRPISYTYDTLSRIRTMTDGNSQTITYDYDQFDRVVQVSEAQGGQRVPLQQTEYDANGNKTRNFFGGTTPVHLGGSTITKTYSPRNQVVQTVHQSGVILPTETMSYTYDRRTT